MESRTSIGWSCHRSRASSIEYFEPLLLSHISAYNSTYEIVVSTDGASFTFQGSLIHFKLIYMLFFLCFQVEAKRPDMQ